MPAGSNYPEIAPNGLKSQGLSDESYAFQWIVRQHAQGYSGVKEPRTHAKIGKLFKIKTT